jgi:hypothetical protein
LERAAARICREAGARVTTNTSVADLNIPSVHRLDDCRIEVIANGLPLWGGCQLAVDTGRFTEVPEKVPTVSDQVWEALVRNRVMFKTINKKNKKTSRAKRKISKLPVCCLYWRN